MFRILVAIGLAALCLAAADDPCDSCRDRWDGRLDAGAYTRHETLVEAGRGYAVILAPSDANADLVVSADGDWPPDPILCRSAAGGTAVDRCEIEANASGPLYVFVVGGELATGYTAGVARPGR